jgi:hypothetical protein
VQALAEAALERRCGFLVAPGHGTVQPQPTKAPTVEERVGQLADPKPAAQPRVGNLVGIDDQRVVAGRRALTVDAVKQFRDPLLGVRAHPAAYLGPTARTAHQRPIDLHLTMSATQREPAHSLRTP